MEAAAYAGRLYDHLSRHFGPGSVFRDIDAISSGEDFRKAIESALNACDVALILIGNTWATCVGKDGQRRLDDPNDWVRIETAAALRRNILVVPVLVEGARLPDPASVPEELRPLCQRHACELSDLRWSFDVGKLVKDLEKVVRSPKRFTVPDVRDRRLRWLAGSVIVLALLISMTLFGPTVLRKAPPIQSGILSVAVKPSPMIGNSVTQGMSPTASEKQGEDKEPAVAPAPGVTAKDKRVNLLAKENGGQVLASSYDRWDKTITGGEYESKMLHLGEWGVFAFKDERPATFDMFTMLIFRSSPMNVKEFELLQGNESPTGFFQSIGTFETQNVKLFKTPYQEFTFSPVTAKYLKVKILSGWEGISDVWVYQFQLFGVLQ